MDSLNWLGVRAERSKSRDLGEFKNVVKKTKIM